LVPGQWAGPGAQQFPGGGIEEHQRGFLDADADPAAAEDLRGDDVTPGQVHLAVLGDHLLDLDRGAGFGFGQRWWPAGPRPGGYQLGQVGDRQVGADGLHAMAVSPHDATLIISGNIEHHISGRNHCAASSNQRITRG